MTTFREGCFKCSLHDSMFIDKQLFIKQGHKYGDDSKIKWTIGIISYEYLPLLTASVDLEKLNINCITSIRHQYSLLGVNILNPFERLPFLAS